MSPGWGGFAKGRKRDQGMNKLEAAFSEELDLQVQLGALLWRSTHEPMKLRLADKTFYTPDFLALDNGYALIVYDVKGGLFPEHNRVKMKVVAELYPLRFVIVRRPRVEDPWVYEPV